MDQGSRLHISCVILASVSVLCEAGSYHLGKQGKIDCLFLNSILFVLLLVVVFGVLLLLLLLLLFVFCFVLSYF